MGLTVLISISTNLYLWEVAMITVTENRNVQRALAMVERDLRRAAIEYQTYGSRRDRLEGLQAVHRDFTAGLFLEPAAVMAGPSYAAAERRAA